MYNIRKNIRKYHRISIIMSGIIIILLIMMLIITCMYIISGNNMFYTTNLIPAESTYVNAEPVSKQSVAVEVTGQAEEKYLLFTDSEGETYEMTVNPDVPQNIYNKSLYSMKKNRIIYNDGVYRSRTGIDVSHHQKKIDWQAVAKDGIEFAFIRIGYRGYGKEGRICKDEYYKKNIEGAHKAGLDVGVYFFSQAVNEDEAIEEAEYTLELLDGITLELPVVYDPEIIPDDRARTDNVTGEQFTFNSIAYCNAIQAAGYRPMIYSNMIWEAYKLDLARLPGIPVWYADYQAVPQTPYDFTFWQYSESGKVRGVKGRCDMDIQMIKD